MKHLFKTCSEWDIEASNVGFYEAYWGRSNKYRVQLELYKITLKTFSSLKTSDVCILKSVFIEKHNKKD